MDPSSDSPLGPRWQRFLSAYQDIAVFLLNFGILLIVTCLVLAAVYSVVDQRRQARRTAVYSQHFDLESYLLVDLQVARETGAEFDAMGEAESYRYSPWTVFTERPFAGRWVTVDEQGVRAGSEPEPADGRPTLTVWAFGGSTQFGWGQPNHQTIASHLQGWLQEQLPERAVRVVNHGHSYWFSSMELNHFLALLRHHPPPDVAIFLDGLNDSRMFLEGRHLPFFSHVADRAWEAERQRRYKPRDVPWFSMGRSFPLLRVARSLRSRLGLDPPTVKDDPDLEPVDVPTALRRYAVNRQAIESVGRELGIETLQFLQPIPGFGPYVGPTHQMAPEIYDFYRALTEAPGPDLIPIHDAVHHLERPFVDQTHYSDEGCRQVALRMGPYVLARLLPAPEGS